MATKYTCKLTKEEIIKIIATEFNKVNEDYSKAIETNSQLTDNLVDLAKYFGKYQLMIDLLEKIKIYEIEE